MIKSNKYKAGRRKFYFVTAPEKTKWFKAYKAKKKSVAKMKKASKKTNKKAVKKVSKKKVTKAKTVKKTAKPKKAVKKSGKKTVKKVAKKSAKKTVKKTTKKPSKTVKKTSKKPLSMAQKYSPKVKAWTTTLDWGDSFSKDAYSYITNTWDLPSETNYTFVKPVNTKKGGFYQTNILVTYPDGSKETVGPVSFVVKSAQADAYNVTVKNTTVPYGHYIDIRKDIVTNPVGYFPNDPAEVTRNTTEFRFCRADGNPLADDPDTTVPGSHDYYILVEYPDDSYQVSQKFTLTVSQPDNLVYHPALKSSSITLPVGTDIEGDTYQLLKPQDFISNTADMPRGTKYEIRDDYSYNEQSSSYVTIDVTFPDGTTWQSPMFLLSFK
ncbi:Rib/alpha-like domain-containing protein [Lactobacillus sp.]|uniref:Rib/alpha-like domain-containing protein n=1 Tax=Lactobacillus sp. TaxID=1591 RepID=UPI003F06EB0C